MDQPQDFIIVDMWIHLLIVNSSGSYLIISDLSMYLISILKRTVCSSMSAVFFFSDKSNQKQLKPRCVVLVSYSVYFDGLISPLKSKWHSVPTAITLLYKLHILHAVCRYQKGVYCHSSYTYVEFFHGDRCIYTQINILSINKKNRQ